MKRGRPTTQARFRGYTPHKPPLTSGLPAALLSNFLISTVNDNQT